MLKKLSGEFTQRSDSEADNDARLYALARARHREGGFGSHWNHHSTVFMKRQVLSRLLYEDHLYRRIVNVPGVICEFGVHWGATMTTLCNLRGIHEPYNHSRTIVGFDTFSGFTGVHDADGGFSSDGDYSTSTGYEAELAEILALQESFSPVPQIQKFELVKGDVVETLPKWLDDNSHAVVAMAIFDMDIYQPTRAALEMILPRLVKGSLLVFDEMVCKHFPGETQAVMEVLGLNNLKLERFPHQPFCAFAEFGA
ncbi:TylF/MycF/NovP-related O-methyltransferase [Sphingomonas psychrotolerans]|uniref:Crotonobetainyl-CoA--carnitine CoA-transferase n=1 Tax=Sphingomonas psychrotolerans TaxID=1327635 RepID=A0A2K8MAH2_9SPHN|nr:TylF/MycF/NovP-related O-methyltransferase [Sphingomonas psychrotolerans]ATY30873.1 crotonobetainyl-CoA--carnitine CoA-transferase [Sphingomonas psychrotolerans]